MSREGSATPLQVRRALLARDEIALVDVRDEDRFAQGHPLFAAQIPLRRIAVEARWRIPRLATPIIVYDGGEGLTAAAAAELRALGYSDVSELGGGLDAWAAAGYELFEDVNSYSKAFGELVEHRRRTPSLSAEQVQALLHDGGDFVILDARRRDEYHTMNIPTSTSVPGADLVHAAAAVAGGPDPIVIVNCAGRTRSIIGAQSLINAGLPNPVFALRNGTIGWTLAAQALERGQDRRAPPVTDEASDVARKRAREVAYRAGVKRLAWDDLAALKNDDARTLYLFDVRDSDAFEQRHAPGFRQADGGQLVQEIDHQAPVRGARIVLFDDEGPRADMTASWLAQLGWEVFIIAESLCGELETGDDGRPPPRDAEGRYRRPYEGVDNAEGAMQAYLDWEYGLVDQLERDGTHGFYVI